MGFVYVARCQEYHKIGFTDKKPAERIKALQTGNPNLVEFVGAVPGTMQDESNWHYRFDAKRIRGEWFLLTPDDVQLILQSGKEEEPKERLSLEQVIELLEGARNLPVAQGEKFLREITEIMRSAGKF